MYKFHAIEEAIEHMKQGKMVVVVDDENRENEGEQRILLICIRFGSCEVRRLNRA